MPALLYSNSDLTILVVDIPCSLENSIGGFRIGSSAPRSCPYTTPEPKGKKRDDIIARLSANEIWYQRVIENTVNGALTHVASLKTSIQWCLPRVLLGLGEDDLTTVVGGPQTSSLTSQIPIVLAPQQNVFTSVEDIQHVFVCNPGIQTVLLVGDQQYLIAGQCKFFWTKINTGLHILRQVELLMRFDLILMDPPWPNRSVRNSDSYSVMGRESHDAFDCALDYVREYSITAGYVAIWITNKHSVRLRVLTALTNLGFELMEEWIWLKTTDQGEPITPLHGVWRKPYEVLMIFHRATSHEVQATRRVIFAVPDLHSRKPNLKQLFEAQLKCFSVLELFARNLTMGWVSIGDEVLKFQHSRMWQSRS